jgi:propane monooxygenase large subunit
MSASLTLNKITAQKGIGITEAANRVADLGWTPSYVQEAMTFPTDYKISKVARDPMKQVLRSYFPMQEEKDNRVYGALDAALRGDMFRNVEPRWVEWMKLFLAIIPFPEISAARSMAMVGRLAPGEELRTGFTMQMVDEFRHSTIQMNLKKWYMENYIDPAGFDITEAAFGKCYATTIGRQFAEGFITGDAITSANVYLTVVAETAFTNTLFVAMPSEAARNGDYALPTVFLSVQSDESRHIGNGHSMLMSMINNPDNHLLLERDLKYAFWQNHAIVDAAIGTFIEYGTTAGFMKTITGPICCRSRNTASRSTMTTSLTHGTDLSRRTTSTRLRSSSRSAGRSISGASRLRPRRISSGSSTNIRAGTPSSVTIGSGTARRASLARPTSCSTRRTDTSIRTVAGAAWCLA